MKGADIKESGWRNCSCQRECTDEKVTAPLKRVLQLQKRVVVRFVEESKWKSGSA